MPKQIKVSIPGQTERVTSTREVPQNITEPTPAAVPPQREARKSWRKDEKN